jgi:tRNA (guanine-N7-)-methyltransferase
MTLAEATARRTERVGELARQLRGLALETSDALTIEIGCGHGHFLTAFAAAHPEQTCVAIDLLRERLERAARKASRMGLSTIHWLKADVLELLDAWPEGVQVNRHIFILFPDPWPKRRHWKHRLIQPQFLSRLATLAAPGTTLCFRTDHAPYFEEASECLRSHPDWRLVPADVWPFEQPTVFQSRAASYQSAVAQRRPGPAGTP